MPNHLNITYVWWRSI